MRNKCILIPSLVLFGELIAVVHSHRSAARAFADKEAARNRRMNAMIAEVRADTLFEAINQIGRQSGCPIRIDRPQLEAAQINAATECHARLTDVTLAESLKVVGESYYLRTHLGWWWEGDSLVISTTEEAAKRTVTLRAFDVRDLDWANQAKDSRDNSPTLCFGGTPNPSGGGSGGEGGGSGSGLFGNAGASNPLSPEDDGPLARLIRDTIAMDSWRDSGGTIGRISRMGGRLYITQTPENHAKIAAFLDQLRAMGSWD